MDKMAKTIMLQGTSSSVGKSVLSSALCRIFLQDGYCVAPFKAQNMALNSFVTVDGGEMGRAQAVQAAACRITPQVTMNPVLLKPTEPALSQVIVLGKPIGNLSAVDYHHRFKNKAWQAITESLSDLMDKYEMLVIEGAGSPAEVNLKANDVVNMRVAKEIQAPVLLIADIDKGGALAAIVGTLELLEPEERELVKGLIINKFRGDIALLEPALDFLEQKTKKPVLGVIPYFTDIKIPEEDSVIIESLNSMVLDKEKMDIVVINLPQMANFTDFDALNFETDVQLRYVREATTLGRPDLIIIPGSKNTLVDLEFLMKSGIGEKVLSLYKNYQVPIIGICGGFQILGLGLLKIDIEFSLTKKISQVNGIVTGNTGILAGCCGLPIEGYKIPMNIPKFEEQFTNPFYLDKSDKIKEGALSPDGLILGTYLHGIFDNDLLRRQILNNLRVNKGWDVSNEEPVNFRVIQEDSFNKLAFLVRNNLDMSQIYEIMNQND